jgi:Holliday junction resolvase
MLTEKFQETDKKFQESERVLTERFKETDKKINELTYLFTSHWGKLVESLVEGDLIRLLNERGIKVQRTLTNVDGVYQGKNFEFDIIAINGETIVIVEVKTTLRPNDVKKFVAKLKDAKIWMPEYKNMQVLGAMAYIKVQGGSRTMAIKKGLFVIRATGNSASIVNENNFKPHLF